MSNLSWRARCLNYPNIMFGNAVKSARSRAKKKGLPFNLTREYVINMFNEQDGLCYYSGLTMSIVKSDITKTHDPLKMSLDCVDPEKGYVEGNVVWCAYCVNALKLKMSKDDMVDICRAIVKKADFK